MSCYKKQCDGKTGTNLVRCKLNKCQNQVIKNNNNNRKKATHEIKALLKQAPSKRSDFDEFVKFMGPFIIKQLDKSFRISRTLNQCIKRNCVVGAKFDKHLLAQEALRKMLKYSLKSPEDFIEFATEVVDTAKTYNKVLSNKTLKKCAIAKCRKSVEKKMTLRNSMSL